MSKDTWLVESINVEGNTAKKMKAVEVFAAVIEFFKGHILKALQVSHGDGVIINTEGLDDSSSKTGVTNNTGGLGDSSSKTGVIINTEGLGDSSSKTGVINDTGGLGDGSSKAKTRKFCNDDVHWVLTVPAIWDLKAKQFMRDAAEKVRFMVKGQCIYYVYFYPMGKK